MDSPPSFSAGSSPRFAEDFNASPPHNFHTLIPNDIYSNYHDLQSSRPYYGVSQIRRNLSDSTHESHETGTDATLVEVIRHRAPDKQRPASPCELVSPLPQSIQHDWDEKEVAIPPAFPEACQLPEEEAPQGKRIYGLRKSVWLLLISLIVLLGLGLGLGLGIGLTRKHSSSSPSADANTEYLIGGALEPQYFSTSGAFNGSGIALAQQSFAQDLATGTQGTVVLYFQHWTGQIRWQQLSNGGEWLGGDETTIVATDAKNSTPLSAVSYASHGTSTWHIFYINQNNTISQKTNSNVTNVWVDGPITAMRLPALDSDEVGMQACWYGNDYGDSDYTHTPIPGQNSTNSSSSSDVGMHIWYASDNTTFQQYGWRAGDDTWTFQEEWPSKNGHAGVGCYSWGPGTVTYVMMVNLDSTVEFWWKDTNTNLTGTAAHPINTWINSSIAINDVYPSSALGYTNYFYAQMADDLTFNGYNISWAAENTTIESSDTFTVAGESGLPGTHLSVTAIPNNSGGNQILVFYQTNGSDISEYTRDLVAGQWSSVSLPIPDS